MQAGIQIDATIFGKFGIKVRSLVKPEMPVKLDSGSITLGIPVLGSVTIYWDI
jgi:hypothetical protein